MDLTLPPLDFRHLFAMTDDTGLFQHALYDVPDRRHGYCVDDNARALIVAAGALSSGHDNGLARLAGTYLSYLYGSQREDGLFRNFMDFDRRFTETVGSEDCFGRSVWAAGFASYHLRGGHAAVAEAVFRRALPPAASLRSLRSQAYSILGFHHFLQGHRGDDAVKETLEILADSLIREWGRHATGSWRWFEDLLAYANARLPQALFLAHRHVPKPAYLDVALEATEFITAGTVKEEYLRPVGNKGWWKKGSTPALYDQQPIDAGASAELYVTAYAATQEGRFLDLARLCFQWFLGRNSRGQALYDKSSGGCHDGLNEDGVNQNMGAESLLSYLMARLVLEGGGWNTPASVAPKKES